jgi:hypothetical protein
MIIPTELVKLIASFMSSANLMRFRLSSGQLVYRNFGAFATKCFATTSLKIRSLANKNCLYDYVMAK